MEEDLFVYSLGRCTTAADEQEILAQTRVLFGTERVVFAAGCCWVVC